MEEDRSHMGRALELASSVAFTSPNPRVGAVLVRSGRILGEGRHEGAGTPHAEARVLRGVDARGATLYVTLEPCVHHGRTPPCAPAIAAAGVARVVAALQDPDQRVAGRGLEALRSAGIRVELGLLEGEAKRLNAGFIHQRVTGRPLVTLKLALTLDGRLAAPDGSSRWITGPGSRALVHRRRAEVDAVMIGAGTVLADDPSLSAREIPGAHQPARVVVDARGRVPATARVLAGAEAIVATTPACPHELQTAWKERGAEVVVLPAAPGGSGVDLGALLETLGHRGFTEVYCEGGAELAGALLRSGGVGRLELTYAPLLVGRGGAEIGELGIATLSEVPRWTTVSVDRIDHDVRVVLESDRLQRLLAPAESGSR